MLKSFAIGIALALSTSLAGAAPLSDSSSAAVTFPPAEPAKQSAALQMPGPVIADPAPQGVRISEAGVFANYFAARGAGKHPGIIVLGGSEGGLGTGSMRVAKALHAHGFDVLQLAYFGVPGAPHALAKIPLETFDRGLSWLKARPEVEANRIGLEGASRGAEAALLYASRTPDIKAVVVGMPSSVVWQGMNFAGSATSSWTDGGQSIPFLPYGPVTNYNDIYGAFANGLKAQDKHADAIIPVEKINGPVMLVCGEADTLWPSCAMSEEIVARLRAMHFRFGVQLLKYKDAGHAVFGLPVDRNDPEFSTLGSIGGSVAGNEAAREASWPHALALFDEALKK